MVLSHKQKAIKCKHLESLNNYENQNDGLLYQSYSISDGDMAQNIPWR